MVPEHTRPPRPRAFSPEVAAQLEAALRSIATKPAPLTDSLRAALTAAATEARELQLRPEELIVAFKTLEEKVGATFPDDDPDDPDGRRFRAKIIRALLEAYYAG